MFGSRIVTQIGNQLRSKKVFQGSVILGALTSSILAYGQYQKDRSLHLDSSKENLNSISVDKSVDPIPLSLSLSTHYQLLAQGTRAVTFLKFRVYVLGIYAANDDIYKISQVINSNFLSQTFIDTDNSKSHSENTKAALQDQAKSKVLISNLLDSNIRLVARICPVRNTDFNHLKDGLVKSILAAKIQSEDMEEGLQQLRDAFTRRGSVPKNNNLILERLSNGQLVLSYEDTKKNELTELGRVNNPIISKVLFLQYLSGGLSNDTKNSAIERISQLVSD